VKKATAMQPEIKGNNLKNVQQKGLTGRSQNKNKVQIEDIDLIVRGDHLRQTLT